MTKPLVLLIDRRWDGAPIASAERAGVTLATLAGGWEIVVEAPFHDDPPPEGSPGSTDGLWNHEVVELFVAVCGPSDRVRYTEIELSPHGHHLVLDFRGVRRRQAVVQPLSMTAGIEGARWHARMALPLDALPPQPWRVNAFAIHGVGRHRRYLAAFPVPGERPDFHQPAAFPMAGGLP